MAVVGLAAGFVAAATAGIKSNCEASTYAIEPEPQKSWWSRLFHTADPRHLWQQPHEQNIFLEEMQDDPKVTQHCRSTAEAIFAYLRCMHALSTAVLLTHSSYVCDASMHMAYATVYVRCMYARKLLYICEMQCTSQKQCNAQVSVVLALALPFLSLAFGYIPAKKDLDTAADMVQANVEDLNGWEISSLLWAAARLGYRPADHVMEALLQQVLLRRSLCVPLQSQGLQLCHATACCFLLHFDKSTPVTKIITLHGLGQIPCCFQQSCSYLASGKQQRGCKLVSCNMGHVQKALHYSSTMTSLPLTLLHLDSACTHLWLKM